MLQTNHNTDLGRWSGVLFVGVLGVVLWAPIPFGSIEPWAVGVLRMSALTLAGVWALACASRGVVVFSRSPLQLILYVAALYALIQSVSFGGTAISSDPFDTRQSALTLACMALLFSVALVALDRPHRLETAAKALFWLGFVLSVLAVLQLVSGTDRIYGIRASAARLFFGPFPNKNHFAGMIELVLPLGLGLLVTGAIPRAQRALYGFGAVAMCVAVVLSRSRGGLLSLGAEFVLLGVTMFVLKPSSGEIDVERRAHRFVARSASALILTVAVAIGVLWVGADDVVESIAELPQSAASESAISRNVIWRDTMTLVRDHPVLGTGIGAYGVAFSHYTTSPGTATILHAHNDYLQVLADAGIVGAVLAILLVSGIGYLRVKGLKRKEPVLRGVALGASVGCLGLLVHSFVDFNLQIPSNALMFLFVIALAVRAANGGAPTPTLVRSTT